jgi:hypothetical protein
VWATDLGGIPGDLSCGDVAEVRALLRQPDVASRRNALERMDAWAGLALGPGTASAVLRAATQSYPWLRGERTDPADRFAHLLRAQPAAVPVGEVEGAYLVASDRVRRSLLHLLALRRDRDGLASVGFLIGPDGPTDLLPLPTAGLLDPVLDCVTAPALAPALVSVAGRRGWAWHAADLLRRLAHDDRLDAPTVVLVVDGIVPLVDALVDTCDRSSGPPAGTDLDAEALADHTRADRHRIRALLQLLADLPSDDVLVALRRALAAADPRVAALGAVALVQRDRIVAPERLTLIARDAAARGVLVDGLEEQGRLDLLPPDVRTGRLRAEADLVRWLAADTELGRPPDEVEHVRVLPQAGAPDGGLVHLFRFRVRAPHWSCARGWMIGAAGPYQPDGSVAPGVARFASSVYGAEDEDDPTGHLDAILESMVTWPDPDDGA